MERKQWTNKEIDDAYNYGAVLGGLLLLGLDEIRPFNHRRGVWGRALTFFAGVGAGGTVVSTYLYSQGVYDDVRASKVYSRAD